MTVIKKKDNMYSQGCGKTATLMYCGRNIFNWYSHFRRWFGSF